MSHEVLNTMRALREDMRQRLMQAPEYRAMEALDRSIDELSAILQSGPAVVPEPQPAQVVQPAAQEPPRQAVRQGGDIASAFAETLAAKLEQRNYARAVGATYLPTHRVAEG